MGRCREVMFTLVQATVACLLALPLQAEVPLRVRYPLQASGLGSDWRVDPTKGCLTVNVARATVPGDLPILVAFRDNAANASEASTVGVWQLVTDPDTGKSYRTYVASTTVLARGAFATVHFGFITSGDVKLTAYANTSIKPDTYTPRQFFVLEDGTEYSSEDFTPFNITVGSSFTLAHAFGLVGQAASSILVASSGRLATYTATLSDLGSWSTKAAILAPCTAYFTVVTDRDRARIYAPLGAKGAWLPILWLDRFGHGVTFTHRLFTTGLPAGISEWAAPQFPGPPGGGNQWKAIIRPARPCRRRAAAQQPANRGDQSHAAAQGPSGPCGEPVGVSSPWPRLWNGC